jgi:DNA (cytosine-5)-methyltransferase 1
MTHGSLFSGIGGFDLAAEWMGWENIFHCEWNPFGQKVLKYHFPNAISYEDITKTDFTIHRGRIDILTGGFPCQPYSMAGKRLGKEDERHLWPEMLRAIREIQPRWVVGENVFGLVNWSGGMVFHEVQADLEAEGYEVQPYVLPAVSVNAPHRRDRVWFVAYSNGNGRGYLRGQKQKCTFETHSKYCNTCDVGNTTDANSIRLEQCE